MQKAQKRRKNYIKALLNQTSFENGWNDEKIEQNSKSKFGHENYKLLKQGRKSHEFSPKCPILGQKSRLSEY